ncbi:putative acyl-CoA ligase [Streptomyces humidus]|uniref:Acyl-CoA ligase n=1 Tax=Streptomyces humidus TaxID=52259 RepID=A0A918L8X7_9ACTN|nr:acyl-CoA synthetase [Streptomyces humidus]GGS20796.1 putative acyl-CoA ligase [Streptomyces humidus]
MYPGTHAQTTPAKPAVVMAASGRTLTYAELDDQSRRLAVGLHDLGLRRGDVVAMLSDNAPECFVLYWAALRSGLYLTAVNHHLTASEAAYIVRDSGAKVLFASGRLEEQASDALAECPGLETAFSFDGPIPGYGVYETFLESAEDRMPAEQPRGSDMLYSSGTTGRPKGIKPPLLPIAVDEPGDPLTALAGTYLGVGPDDVYLSPAPIYHAAPLRWCGVVHAYGGTVVVLEKFSAEGALEALQNHRVTVVQMVPTMFVRMLQLDSALRTKYDLSSLRLAIHAAAPCPVEVKRAMLDWWGPKLVEYYSSTEMSGMTVITTPEWLKKPGSVGRSVFGPIHICDERGEELCVGEVGRVYFERDVRPFEYHNEPEKTKAAEHPDHANWTAIGDLGYVDDDGYLFLTDRESFMIISGGVNIYPQEVENALALHPAVYDIGVVGIPDPVMGQQVKAFVALRPGITPSDALAEELIAYARTKVAAYKAPRSVEFIDELPRTPTGKLVKSALTARTSGGATGGH